MTLDEHLSEVMRSCTANRELLEQAKSYAYSYMDQARDRAAFPNEEAIGRLGAFDEPFPESSCDPVQVLALLHDFGSPATVAQTGGRYFGFVNGGALPVSIAARWLADVWDQNAALCIMSPIASQLERTCERWLRSIFGLPPKTVAGFVSGTSIATMCGLAAGRWALLKRMGWDVNSNGLYDAPRLRVVLGEQAHATVLKALALLGLGTRNVVRVPVDSQGRMNVSQMPALDDHTLVIAQAGNVHTGAFDPFEEICDRANPSGAWVHIDGAFGLWASGSRNKGYLTRGIERANSWSVDAHKTLNASYDCGIILCSDRDALVGAMQATGSYIQYGEKRDGMLYTPEMSRRARAVDLWATLKSLGRTGVEELVDGLCDRAAQFAAGLRGEGFHVLNDVVFNQVLVTCDDPDLTNQTLKNMQTSGECWCGGSTWNGAPVIRISVCSWATTAADVDRSLAAFVQARREALSKSQLG